MILSEKPEPRESPLICKKLKTFPNMKEIYPHVQQITLLFSPYPEACLGPYRISKIKYFVKIVNGLKLLTTTFAKRYILDVWKSSEYASVFLLYFT